MSRNAEANANFITFWIRRQWDALTHPDSIAGNGAAWN
jgi:hypothetical protein